MTLATIQRIDKLTPIEGADRIETAHILGWTVVVRKGEFKEGDLCIYIEIDSILPRAEWSEFLFKHEEDTQYRLKTIKLKKQISQGLVLPITVEMFPSIEHIGFHLEVGDNVTESLGIKKYEKPTPTINIGGQRIKVRTFPAFIPKTDEIRIQSAPELLERLKGQPYYITQKLDGTSSTFYKYKGKFGVCSRNMDLGDPSTPTGFWQFLKREFRKLMGKTKKSVPSSNLYWDMARKYNIKEWLPDGYAVQGEICGPGIQGNKMGLNENELFIFNVFNIKEYEYKNPVLFRRDLWPNNYYNLVPILFYDGGPFLYCLDELLELAKGNYSNGTPQEGIVVRSLDQSISFKVINNDFLLKYGE